MEEATRDITPQAHESPRRHNVFIGPPVSPVSSRGRGPVCEAASSPKLKVPTMASKTLKTTTKVGATSARPRSPPSPGLAPFHAMTEVPGREPGGPRTPRYETARLVPFSLARRMTSGTDDAGGLVLNM